MYVPPNSSDKVKSYNQNIDTFFVNMKCKYKSN